MAGALQLILDALRLALDQILQTPGGASAAAAAAAAAAEAFWRQREAGSSAADAADAVARGGVIDSGQWPLLGERAVAVEATVRRAADLCQRSCAGHDRTEVHLPRTSPAPPLHLACTSPCTSP